jgi:hypothetical protein
LANRVLHEPIVSTPRGEASFLYQPGVQEALARLATLPPDDSYFFYPYMPMLPFLADRRHASKYDVFTPDYTTPLQYHEACRSVMRDASWLVINRQWTDSGFWKKLFPAMENAEPPESKAFEQALDGAFEFVARDGPFEFRRRLAGISDAACADIAQ